MCILKTEALPSPTKLYNHKPYVARFGHPCTIEKIDGLRTVEMIVLFSQSPADKNNLSSYKYMFGIVSANRDLVHAL